MKTSKTITFTIVSILEFKAQHITHNIEKFVESTSLQTNYKQRRHSAFAWNNNGKTFSIANYLSLYNYSIRWGPDDAIHNLLLL